MGEVQSGAPSWVGLLDSVATGAHRLVLETSAGERVVLLAERELLALEEAARAARPGEGSGRLTAREAEVLQLVAEGCSGADIAARLGLATNTVAQHLAAVRRKFDVPSSAAAVVAARRAGALPEA